MKARLFTGAAALAAAALTLSACGGGSGSSGSTTGSSSAPQSGGNLIMDRAEDATSMVPWVPTDNASIWVMEEIYDTLLVPAPNGKAVEPSLATKWVQSSDGKSWTFTLRKGVKFSNGKPLTSADVEFSLDQARAKNTPFYFIDQIITGIDTPSPYTVVIHTAQPWAPLPADMALFANSIVPKNFGGETQAQFANHPVGSGPFEFSSWTKGQSLKLVKNPHYWQPGKPYLNSVTFDVVADSNTRATQVQSGQAQINEFPDYSSIQALKGSSTVKVGLFSSSRVDYFVMNNKEPQFADPNVRLAVAQAVDKSALIKSVLFGNGKPATSYLTPALWAHDSSISPPPYNISQAKQDLAKSKYPHGFATSILIESGDADQASAAQIIQASLGQIGIKTTIKTLDPTAQYQALQNENFDMSFAYCTTDIIDPDEIIRFAAMTSGGSNAMYSQYEDQQNEKLAGEADLITDQSKRQQLYDQIQDIVNKAVPYVAMYYSPSVYSYSTNVHGFDPYPTGNYDLVSTWISH